MNYGLYVSASGVLTNMYRQDVFANNLANVNTVGFKPDVATVRQRDAEAVEGQFGMELRKAVLDNLGGGVQAGTQRINHGQAGLEGTGGPLDVALETENAYFAVRSTDPATGQQRVALTRDGRFSHSHDGHLVMMTNGMQVLDVQNNPIRLPNDATITINGRGEILANGDAIARLQVTAVADPDQLIKQGASLFRWAEGTADPRRPTPNASVRQGYVERSGVNPIDALMDMLNAGKAAEGNGRMIQFFDDLMNRAVNVLGVVR